jgi:hypothetical protein
MGAWLLSDKDRRIADNCLKTLSLAVGGKICGCATTSILT